MSAPLTRPTRWALRPWRRHSLVVGAGGLVYVCYGVSLLVSPIRADRQASLQLADILTLDLPLQVWGVVWVGVGVLALLSTRWPPESETWGYTCLAALAGLWASVYLLGIIFLGAPESGFSAFLAWSLVGVLWWGISGLRNPDDLPTWKVGP